MSQHFKDSLCASSRLSQKLEIQFENSKTTRPFFRRHERVLSYEYIFAQIYADPRKTLQRNQLPRVPAVTEHGLTVVSF